MTEEQLRGFEETCAALRESAPKGVVPAGEFDPWPHLYQRDVTALVAEVRRLRQGCKP